MELKKTERGMTIGGGLIIPITSIAGYIFSDYQYFLLPFSTMLWQGLLFVLVHVFGVILIVSIAISPFILLVESRSPDRYLLPWSIALNLLQAILLFIGTYFLCQTFAVYL